jgi:trehalose 6-phosphate phosphatase
MALLRHLYTPEGAAALAALARERPLLAFDFDGTLAPTVARPDDARVSAAVASKLARLALHVPVAVVSGRTVADVRRRLDFAPTFVVGNHGAEDAERPAPPAAVATLDALRRELATSWPSLAAAGVQIEDKGVSIALHYRLARDREAACARIAAVVERLDPGLRHFAGKCAVNVVAAGAPDKGDAVCALVERARCSAALFVGDDASDETVFERARARWVTVRVGREDRGSRARFFLDSASELATLLQRLLVLLAN